MTDFTLHFTRQSLEQLHSVLVSASHFLPEAFEGDIKLAQTFKHDVADTLDVPEHTAESVNFLKEVNLESFSPAPVSPPAPVSLDGEGGNLFFNFDELNIIEYCLGNYIHYFSDNDDYDSVNDLFDKVKALNFALERGHS